MWSVPTTGEGAGEFGPGHQAGAPGEAAAEGSQKETVAGPDPPPGRCVGQSERDGGGPGVADGVDVGHAALPGQAQVVGDGVQDAQVGLVGHEVVDVVGLPAGLLQGGPRRGGHPGHRVPVDLLAAHREVPFGVGGFAPGGPLAGTSGGDRDQVLVGAVAAEVEVADRAGLVGPSRAQDDGAGAVAEDDRVGAVQRVDDGGVGVRPDQQHPAGDPGGDQTGGGREAVHEPGAHRPDIEGRRPREAEAGGHHGCGGGAGTVRGGRGDDHRVGGGATGRAQGEPTGFDGEVGGGLARLGDVSAANPGAGAYPGVVGVQACGEFVVGDHTGRHPSGQSAQDGRRARRAEGVAGHSCSPRGVRRGAGRGVYAAAVAAFRGSG